MYMIGWSLGLLLEKVGGEGRSIGRLPVDCEIAVCTSVAAPSIDLASANWSVRVTCPCVLCEVMSSSPLICMKLRSSGVAMLFATVSGLAPG